MADLPVICTLSPEALRARRKNLLPGIWRRAARCEELPDGYRLWFDAGGGIVSAIAEAVEAERLCCRFLDFDLKVPPDGASIVLDLRGPAGTREFLEAMVES